MTQPLSLGLCALPLLGVLALGLLPNFSVLRPNWLPGVAAMAAGAQLAVWVFALAFDATALGADGLSLVSVGLVPLCVLLPALLNWPLGRRRLRAWVSLLAFDSAACAVMCSLDARIFLGSWLVASIALLVLLDAVSEGRRGVARFAFTAPASLALIGYAVLAEGKAPFVWPALLVGCIAMTGTLPGMGWLSPALRDASPAARSVLCVGPYAISAYTLFRWGAGNSPASLTESREIMMLLGVLLAVYASVALLRQRQLTGLVAANLTAHTGFLLQGLGSLTSMGLVGSVALFIATALAAALLSISGGFLERHTDERDLRRLGGLVRGVPALALALGVGVLASAALPGSLAFVGVLLGLLGEFPWHPGLVALALAAWSLAAWVLLGRWRELGAGESTSDWQRNPRLEAHGGRLPAPSRRESSVLLGLAALSLALGVCPRLLLGPLDEWAYDLAAKLNPFGAAQISSLPRCPGNAWQGRRLSSEEGGR
jgi:NADH:ubiquinone oxidoreductase subunit 4 (subunit M)